MDLVCRDRRSPKQGQSYVCEGTLLCCASSPIVSLHDAVIGGWAAKSDAVSLIVGAYARKGAAASDSAFEMIDMRGFEVWASRLIVAAILIQPGNRIGIFATVGSHRLLIKERKIAGGEREREYGQRARFQDFSAGSEPRVRKLLASFDCDDFFASGPVVLYFIPCHRYVLMNFRVEIRA
jgi:hypothetical protein